MLYFDTLQLRCASSSSCVFRNCADMPVRCELREYELDEAAQPSRCRAFFPLGFLSRSTVTFLLQYLKKIQKWQKGPVFAPSCVTPVGLDGQKKMLQSAVNALQSEAHVSPRSEGLSPKSMGRWEGHTHTHTVMFSFCAVLFSHLAPKLDPSFAPQPLRGRP